MTSTKRRADGSPAGGRAEVVGDVVGRTLDHLRWASLLALIVAVGSETVRNQYGLELLVVMLAIAAVAALIEYKF